MADTIFACLLLFIVIGLVVARKTYTYLPLKELKRRAERHDPLAEKLYRAVAYGSSLRVLLLILIILFSAVSFILLARAQPIWLSVVIVLVVLWLAFSWLPDTRVSGLGARFTATATPFFAWLVRTLYPVINRGAHIEEKHRVRADHTGLFERSDLLALIEQQQQQEDNRLSQEELDIVKHTLQFDDLKVADSFTSRQNLKTILASDVAGPILINELHELGQDYVLVSETPRGAIVGILAFKQLSIKTSGHVRDVMDSTVYYVNEEDSLRDVLHAFFTTNHPLFIVINSAEEYLGIITVQDILKVLLGHIPGDDFDQYADRSAVAARHRAINEVELETSDEVVQSDK